MVLLTIFLTSVVTCISTVWIYRKISALFQTVKYNHLQNNIDEGLIYMIDKDVDTKFSLGELVAPTYNAFDKPTEVCQFINKVDDGTPIKLVLSTKGGSLVACEKIMKRLKKHPAGYTAYIADECYSAGTILALGAKEIIMGEFSYIGKIDPQHGNMLNSSSMINFVGLDKEHIGPINIEKVREARNILNYMDEILEYMLHDHEKYDLLSVIKKHFIYSELPHCKLFDFNQCSELNLHVRNPREDEEKYLKIHEEK